MGRGSARRATLLHAFEGYRLAEHGGHAAGQIELVLGLHRDRAGIFLAVGAVVECAGPLVGAGLLGALHDDEADDRPLLLGGIRVLVVGLLPVHRLDDLAAHAVAAFV